MDYGRICKLLSSTMNQTVSLDPIWNKQHLESKSQHHLNHLNPNLTWTLLLTETEAEIKSNLK